MPKPIDTQAAEATAAAVIHGADSDQARSAVAQMLADHGTHATTTALQAVTDRAQH